MFRLATTDRSFGQLARRDTEMADEQIDIVALYGASKGWRLRPRTVLVEGTSDVSLFELAAHLFQRDSGKALLADLAIVAAGERERGGTSGVVRELVGLRNMASTYLSPVGLPVYRIIGLFDNDTAGQKAVHGARAVDASIMEYRDVFRLRPVMPRPSCLDPGALQRAFDSQNGAYKGLTWELEDLIGEPLMSLFMEENPTALLREQKMSDVVHRELTRDGKDRLVHFCKDYADLANLKQLVDVIHALRHYMNLPALQ